MKNEHDNAPFTLIAPYLGPKVGTTFPPAEFCHTTVGILPRKDVLAALETAIGDERLAAIKAAKHEIYINAESESQWRWGAWRLCANEKEMYHYMLTERVCPDCGDPLPYNDRDGDTCKYCASRARFDAQCEREQAREAFLSSLPPCFRKGKAWRKRHAG